MKPNKYKTITVALMLAGLTWTSAYADVKPAEATKPAEVKATDVKPAEAAKPAEVKATDAKPAEAAKPAETKPADAKPAEAAKPAETKPADAKPAEAAKPADAKPAEAAKPAETKPADAKPAEAAKPVEEVKKGKKGVVEEGLKICNKTSVELSAVIAYSTDDADKQWVSQGWTDIKAGECEMALSEKLTKHYYYVFATSDNGDVSIGGDNVNHAFCVDTGEDDNFKIDGNKCAAKDKKKFIEVEVKAALQSFDLKLK
jgi:uncharacterized membrane protein